MKTILTKNKIGGLLLPEFKTYCKASVMKPSAVLTKGWMCRERTEAKSRPIHTNMANWSSTKMEQ